MLVGGYADAGCAQDHLASHSTRTFPNDFDLVPLEGADQFPVNFP